MSENKEAFEMSIRRKLDGTEITFKSTTIEPLMRDWSKKNGKVITHSPYDNNDWRDPDTLFIKDYKAYTLPAILPALPSGKKVWGTFQHGLMFQNYFNMRILTLVGLEKGITFTVPTPYSKQMIEKLLQSANEVVSEFIIEYAKPISGSVVIIQKEEAAPPR